MACMLTEVEYRAKDIAYQHLCSSAVTYVGLVSGLEMLAVHGSKGFSLMAILRVRSQVLMPRKGVLLKE